MIKAGFVMEYLLKPYICWGKSQTQRYTKTIGANKFEAVNRKATRGTNADSAGCLVPASLVPAFQSVYKQKQGIFISAHSALPT